MFNIYEVILITDYLQTTMNVQPKRISVIPMLSVQIHLAPISVLVKMDLWATDSPVQVEVLNVKFYGRDLEKVV